MARTAFRPSFERLCARDLFAGNVDFNVNFLGDLEINGDNQANGIEVSRLSDGRIQITGVPQGGTPTLIRGQAQMIVPNVTRNIEINAREGNDVVRVLSPNVYAQILPGNLDVETGGGNDLLLIEHTVIRGKTDIEMGGDSDRVLVKYSSFDQDAEIGMGLGDGEDTVDLQYLSAWGKLEIDTWGGHDVVSLYQSKVSGDTSIETGDDRDTLSLQMTTFLDDLYADLGAGDDTLYAAYLRTSSTSQTTIRGGGGVDQLHLYWTSTQDTNVLDLNQVTSFEYRYRHLI